jgi:hypothetical protein
LFSANQWMRLRPFSDRVYHNRRPGFTAKSLLRNGAEKWTMRVLITIFRGVLIGGMLVSMPVLRTFGARSGEVGLGNVISIGYRIIGPPGILQHSTFQVPCDRTMSDVPDFERTLQFPLTEASGGVFSRGEAEQSSCEGLVEPLVLKAFSQPFC